MIQAWRPHRVRVSRPVELFHSKGGTDTLRTMGVQGTVARMLEDDLLVELLPVA